MEELGAVISGRPRVAVGGIIIPAGIDVPKGGAVTTGPGVAEALLLDREECDRLTAIALRRFGIPRQEAEDLLAETYLELTACDAVVRSPKGLAYHVFHSRCCRWMERQNQRNEEVSGLEPGASRPNGHATVDIVSSLSLKEAFGRLSTTCRRLLVGYYVEGLSLRETAETTGHSPKQVWKRLDACLRRLKKWFEA